MFNDVDMAAMPDEEPLKCPKCNLVHLVTGEEQKIYEEVIGVDAIKERVKKRNETKLQNLYKNVDSDTPEVQLKQNVQLCHICPPNMVNPQNGAQY